MRRIAVGVGLAVFAAGAQAWALSGEGVLGGEVPTPYADANRKVELADGEVYALVGRVVFPGNEPYLHVDLATHSWLENRRRLANPLYPLLSDGFDWRRYEGLWVVAQVKAVGRLVEDQKGDPLYELFLMPIVAPAAYEGDGTGDSR
ncbi:MAG: hypothetical protein IT285_09755 [Bdellovibrionales bacterium]|nr:hypothetical protein [Bdellovibrionales bacterium]